MVEQYLFDIEVFPNYILFLFRNIATGETHVFYRWKNTSTLKTRMPGFLRKLVKEKAVVWTYNGNGFDIPMLNLWAELEFDLTFEQAMALTDRIIIDNERFYDADKNWGFVHGDIQEILNLNNSSTEAGEKIRKMVGMKEAAANIGHRVVADLPVAPGTILDSAQKKAVEFYCGQDLDALKALVDYAAKDIKLRRRMEEKYNIPGKLFNKGEPRVAKILTREIYRRDVGSNAYALKKEYWKDMASKVSHQSWMKFSGKDKPEYIATAGLWYVFKEFLPKPEEFKWLNPENERLYHQMRSYVRMSGSYKHHNEKYGPYIDYKKKSKKFNVDHQTAGLSLTIGEGGAHDKDPGGVWVTDDEYIVEQRDASSFYPYILHTRNLYPQYLPGFGKSYWNVVQERLRVKSKMNEIFKEIAGRKPDDAELEMLYVLYEELDHDQYSLKIVINSIYGQLGSMFSDVYWPWGGLGVPLSGQLYFLQYIDWLQKFPVEVLHVNTDGLVIRYKRDQLDNVNMVTEYFEKKFKMKVDTDPLGKFVKKNTNSYILFNPDMSLKKATKDFSSKMKPKSPLKGFVVAKALVEYYQNGTPVEQTINSFEDPQGFFFTRHAGSKHQLVIDLPFTRSPAVIQNTQRWYVSDKAIGGTIIMNYAGGRSERFMADAPCFPLLELNGQGVDQLVMLDRNYYINKAKEIMDEIPTI